jgi:hypothetical protein
LADQNPDWSFVDNRIFLADIERAATVRSKIAKAMRIRQATALKDHEATP